MSYLENAGWSLNIVPSQSRLPNRMRNGRRELITPSKKVIKLERMGNGLYMLEVNLTKQQEDNTGICNIAKIKSKARKKVRDTGQVDWQMLFSSSPYARSATQEQEVGQDDM